MISVSQLTTASLANLFDHTQLHADARRADFEKLCAESREYGFKMVAINPAPVALCKELLAGTPVHVGKTAWNPRCLKRSRPSVMAQTRSTTSLTSALQKTAILP